MSTKLPDDLVTVAQYTEMRNLGAVQVVNGWCRKQGAPYHEVNGKRMISVSEMDAWRAEKDQRKAEGKGTTRAQVVQRTTGVKKGALLMHNARKGVVITQVNKISDYLAWGETSHGKGIWHAIPMKWESLAEKLKNGELVLVNPHIIIDLLIAHFEHLGPDKHDQELGLLMQLKQITDPQAEADMLEEREVPAGEKETSEEEEDEDGAIETA